MNVQEYELMNVIMENSDMNQRELAQCTGFSLGKVNHSLRLLEIGRASCRERVS